MDNTFFDDGLLNDSFVEIQRGRIEDITRDNRNTLVTVSYSDGRGRNDGRDRDRNDDRGRDRDRDRGRDRDRDRDRDRGRMEQQIRMVVSNRTIIFDEFGNTIRPEELQRGMTINAIVSSAMTRSIPPQANAYVIRVIRRPVSDNVVTGRIIDIDRNSRMFTTITGNNPASIIRFSVPNNTPVFDMQGRPMGFARLFPGLRVRVRHTAFMTASIPPQTTALEIRVI